MQMLTKTVDEDMNVGKAETTIADPAAEGYFDAGAFSASTAATTNADTARSGAVEPHSPDKSSGDKVDTKDKAADDNNAYEDENNAKPIKMGMLTIKQPLPILPLAQQLSLWLPSLLL
jgi:hypothetical protein